MRVGVFVRQGREAILDVMRIANLHVAQLHGDQDPDFCRSLGRRRVMKVFWPQRYDSRQELERDMLRYEDHARFFLLDGGLVGGGHGKSHDLESLRALKGLATDKTWFLAGGLTPDNLSQAVEACGPCGVDLNSGVESEPGVKDHDKLARAFKTMCRPCV